MRYVLLIFALLSFTSQVTAQTEMSKEPTIDSGQSVSTNSAEVYFLIDASGSVPEAEYRALGRRIAEHLRHLPEDASVSVTYFGAKPNNGSQTVDCGEQIDLTPPQPKQAWTFAPPAQGDNNVKSAIGHALEEALSQASERSNAKIILITDGVEECGADFIGIRNKYPKPDLRVEFIPVNSKAALEYIQGSPDVVAKKEQKSIGGEKAHTFEIDFSRNLSVQRSKDTQWADRNWLESYLWLICFFLLALSAIAIGRKYDKVAVAIRANTSDWQQDLAFRLANTDKNNPNPAKPLVLASLKNDAGVRACDGWFVGCLTVVAPILLSLSLTDGIHQFASDYSLTLIASAELFALVLIWVFPRAKIESVEQDWTKALLQSVSRSPFWKGTVGISLAVTIFASGFFMDLPDAKSAAWYVISSEFATALAVLATAPFLFFGACWVEYQRSYQTNVIVQSQSMSAELRTKMEASEKFNSARNKFVGLLLSLTGAVQNQAKIGSKPIPLSKKVKSGIQEYTKKLVLDEVNRLPTEIAKTELLDRFLSRATNQAEYFKELASIAQLDEREKQHLVKVANAFGMGTPQLINSALGELHREVIQKPLAKQ